jgi:hypothetical protein
MRALAVEHAKAGPAAEQEEEEGGREAATATTVTTARNTARAKQGTCCSFGNEYRIAWYARQGDLLQPSFLFPFCW